MKKIIQVLVHLSINLCIVNSAFAFNWNKCKRFMNRDPNDLFGIDFTTSTSQWSSSSGDCSMIGEKSHDEKVFFAQNFEEIKIDVARGGGEYLSAFNSYSSCQGQDRELQSNYENIFVHDMESSFKNLKKFSCN